MENASLQVMQTPSIGTHRLHWPSPRTLAWIAVAVALLGLAVYWVWQKEAERRAVRNLPPAERSALFQRTLQNVQSVCVQPRDGLSDYCESQANFLAAFPECDAACDTMVRRVLGRGKATR
jgi:hypothetical protein